MSKSHGASSVIPGPMPSKNASLRLVAQSAPSPDFPYDEYTDPEERTIVSAISRDMLGLTDDHGAATKTYEVPRELLELARERRKAQRATSRPPAAGATLEEQLSFASPPVPNGLMGDPRYDMADRHAASTLPPEFEAAADTDEAPPPADLEVDVAPARKPRRKFAVMKWVVLAGVYVAIVYGARIWLPVP